MTQMTETAQLWMRHEVRQTEHRAPIVPADARRLVDSGVAVTVEDSPQRAFPAADYADAGCRIEPAGSWVTAPADRYVVGLKELPDRPAALTQRHVFFGHAYKGQDGGRELLRRFVAGGGALLDLEHLIDAEGRRLAAFGYWAGYTGAALAVLQQRGRLGAPLRPLSKESLDGALRSASGAEAPRALVIGALGRCGRGARDALAAAGITPTCWDIEETRVLDRTALLDHDILVNTVATTTPVRPFLTGADLDDPARRLTVVSDVACDVASDCNVLPIYDRTTTWQQPVRRLRDGPPALDLIAIDNLPSLLPREASVAFSADLLPHLMTLAEPAPAWQRCLQAFHQACRSGGLEAVPADA
jgi:saccharopine dehydrogenase (NAD+, L-lysine-forming)